jgi:hypothetical protein
MEWQFPDALLALAAVFVPLVLAGIAVACRSRRQASSRRKSTFD